MEIKLDLVLIGRILAGVVIFLALLAAIFGAVAARADQFSVFLNLLVEPLAWGFAIALATEMWRAWNQRR